MPEDGDYTFDNNLLGFYNDILDARRRTAASLRTLRNIKTDDNVEDLGDDIERRNKAEQMFYTNLDYYHDLMEYKWHKTEKVEKPKAVKNAEKDLDDKKLFSVTELDYKDAVILYKTLNELCEVLEITSLEKLGKTDKGFGKPKN